MAEQEGEQVKPTFNFAKGVIANEAQELGNLVEAMKQNAKSTPAANIPAPTPQNNTSIAEKKDGSAPEEPKEPIQDKSELDTPLEEPKVEPAKDKKGKKGKKEEKSELPEIVDSEGKKVEIPTIDEGSDEFLESIGAQEKKEEPVIEGSKTTKETKGKKTAEIPKEVTEKLSFLEQENKLLKTDPAYAIAKELIGKGKDGIKELMNKFDLTDYDKLSAKEIYEIDLKNQGLEGEDLKSELSDFEDLSPAKQKLTTNPMRAKLKEQADEKLKSISNAPTEKQVREFTKFQQEASENALAALDERCEKIATKGYNGWKPNEEDLGIIRESVMNHTRVSQDGKSYDVDSSIEEAVWMNKDIRNKILKHSFQLGKYKGYEDWIQKRIRVNPNDHIPGSQGGKPTYSFNNTVKPAQNGQN